MKNTPKPNNTTLFTILGWICAAISLFFIPILFGIGGVVFGALLARNELTKTRGIVLIVFSVIFAFIGVIVGAIIGALTFR